MSEAAISQELSPGLLRVAKRAQEYPNVLLYALAHHVDVSALRRAFGRIRKDAAVGVDGISKEAYGAKLEENLARLHEGLRTMRYRHQPIRRIYIPKENGKQRAIGVSTIADKIVQGALHELLEIIYEPSFLPCSYGFRRGRRAHDALRDLDQAIYKGEAQYILEFDIESYFDSVDRKKLKELLQERIADKSLMRLIGKCLHMGVIDGEEFSFPDDGTVQGSVLSPILGNVYLHHALDLWFERDLKPRIRGKAVFFRYADDGVFGFERREDAQRVWAVLSKRLARFGLRLNPEKTRLIDFRRPPREQPGGKGKATLDFLGFTLYWRRSQKDHWVMTCKTRYARLQRAKKTIADWCRRHRHQPVGNQYAALKRRLQGHFNYFAVRGNERNLNRLWEHTKRSWFKWLNRRSQRQRLGWDRFTAILRVYKFPAPRAKLSLWGATR